MGDWSGMTDQQGSSLGSETSDSASTASSHPLDPALFSLGIALRGLEVEAYMRDELHRGGFSLEAVLGRVLRGRKMSPGSVYQEFTEQVESVWGRVKQEYDPLIDRRAGNYRTRALLILDQNLEWLRKHDKKGTDPGTLGPQTGLALTQMMSLLSKVLAALNGATPTSIRDSTWVICWRRWHPPAQVYWLPSPRRWQKVLLNRVPITLQPSTETILFRKASIE